MRLSFLIASAASAAFLTGCTMPISDTTTATPTAATSQKAETLTPPVAKRVPETITQVGRTRVDPYHWMKDDNWQTVMTDPSVLREDIRDYLVAENAYTKATLEEPTTALQEELFKEMRGRIKEDDSSLPNIDGPYAYLSKYREGGEYLIFARRPAADIYNAHAVDEILIDGDALGEGKAFFSFGALGHSPDHKLVAYSYDDQGSEIYDIKFRDLATGKDLPDMVTGTAGDFVWSENSDAIYWVERDENGRPVAVHQYKIGGDGSSTEIFRESDPGFFTGIDKSQSGEYIFIGVGDQVTSEYHFFKADAVTPDVKLIAAREAGIEYNVEHWGDRFVISTNRGDAVDMKIVTTSIATPAKENWIELVAHDPGTLILGMDVLKDYLIRLERKDGLPRIVVRDRASGAEHEIAFDEAAYDLSMSTGYDYDTTQIRFEYASPSTPDQEYDYDLATQTRTLRKTREVPSGHNPDDYVVERIMAPARDGVTVPVTILRHKDTPIDGSAPMLLYGYGSYGITISARFRTTPLTLVDRGMVYAIVHPRGSMAKGYQWYLDGKLKKKVNTFNDYVDAGRYLIGEGYSSEGKVVGMGGSAGGLLMGAVANQDPTMFAGIIAAVPFVDVINTMSDESLPLTPPEWPEWGNPITSAEDYDTMIAYSPYDQVGDKPYPAMLITGGLSDPPRDLLGAEQMGRPPAPRSPERRTILPAHQHGRRTRRRLRPFRRPERNRAGIQLRASGCGQG